MVLEQVVGVRCFRATKRRNSVKRWLGIVRRLAVRH
jgi:hypothetical protein